MRLGGQWGLLVPGMGGEAARAIPPILQVESLSHGSWASRPRAHSQRGRGLDVAMSAQQWAGGWAGRLLCESLCIAVNTTRLFPEANSLLLPPQPHSFKQLTDSPFAKSAFPAPSPY